MNKMINTSKVSYIVAFLLALLMSALAAPALALDLPGRQMISALPVSPAAAWAALEGATLPTITDPVLPVAPEISGLVRALHNDPDLIFAFVHDTIEYELGYGVRKGAMGTLLDGRGNAYDQAVLLVTLLRQAGYTASYVHGTITLDSQQVTNWLGIDGPTADIVRRILGSAGLPVTTSPATGTTLTSAVLDHVWVKVEIDSTEYVFDPSYKTHAYSQALLPDRAALAAALTSYSLSGFVDHAEDNATIDTNRVDNLNRTNIRQNLEEYADDLVTHIRTEAPEGDLKSVFGGRTIDPAQALVRETTLSYATAAADWTEDIPNCYHTILTLRYGGLEVSLRTADLYGRRLTVFPTSVTTAEIRLDGQVLGTGDDIGILYFGINHPYAVAGTSGTNITYGDQAGVINRLDSTVFHIFSSFGESGSGLVESHRRILQDLINGGAAQDSEAVLGETLALVGFNYAAQLAMSDRLLNQVTNYVTFNHHTLGVVGQTTEGENQRVVMDLAFSRSSHLDPEGQNSQASFMAQADRASMLEAAVIDQTQPGQGLSTSKILDLAVRDGLPVIQVVQGNYGGLGEYNYSAALMFGSLMALDHAWKVIVPRNGGQTLGDWTGTAAVAYQTDTPMAMHMVNGLKGGAGADYGAADPEAAALANPLQVESPSCCGGDPIDLADASFFRTQTDLTVGQESPFFGLDFQTSYYTRSRQSDLGLGYGWSHNWQLAANTISDPHGALGGGSPVAAAAAVAAMYVAFDLLDQINGLNLENLVISSIIHSWLAEKLVDNAVAVSRPGESLHFLKLPNPDPGVNPDQYDPPAGSADRLEWIGDETGHFRLTSKNGEVVDYTNGGLMSTWQDRNGNQVTLTYQDGLLSQVANNLGWSLSLAYENSRLSGVTGAGRTVNYHYDEQGRLTGVEDTKNQTTTYTYDTGHRLVSVRIPGQAELYVINQYDDLGRVREQEHGNGESEYFLGGYRSEEKDPYGHTKVWQYGSGSNAKRLVSETDQLGNTTSYSYDGLGRLKEKVLPEGNRFEYGYDDLHNLTSLVIRPKTGADSLTWTYAYTTDFNLLSSVTDPMGRTTTLTYDASGNLLSMQKGTVTILTMSGYFRGRPGLVTDGSGRSTAYVYNQTRGLLESISGDPSGLDLESIMAYNSVGDLTGLTDPRSNTSIFNYDTERQLLTSTAPNPFTYLTTYEHDALGNLTRLESSDQIAQWDYNQIGRLLTATTPEGHTTAYQYDLANRLAQVIDPETNVTQYQYDEAGRPKSWVDGNGDTPATYTYTPNGLVATVKDAGNSVTTYTYDRYDRLERITYPDGTFEALAWDAAGRLTSRTTRAGQGIVQGYDGLDRLISRTGPGLSETLTYDGAGRVVNASHPNGLVHHVYDGLGRVSAVTWPGGRTVGYEYDGASNLTGLTYPDGSKVTYVYDQMNRLTQVMDDATPPNVLAAYQYDFHSRRTLLTLNNGVTTAYTYTRDDETLNMVHTWTSGTATYIYGFDGNGRRTNLRISNDIFDPWINIPADQTLTSNNLNQLTSINGVTLTYDLNGNLLSDGTHVYTHNAVNRLVGVDGTITYAYDALGRRASKTVNGNITNYVYDGARVIAEYDGAGQLLRKYIYGPGLDEPVLMQAGTTRYYYLFDSLGSAIGLTDTSGNLVEAYRYSPYGQPLQASTVGNPYMFTGREFDSETGLYYYRARYYSPQLRRFIEPDPIGFEGGMNLYAYVGNDPANALDPWGLDSHHIIPQAIWRNMHLSPEVVSLLDSAVVEAGEHYYTANHRNYNALVRVLWDNFFLGAKEEEITSCAAKRFVEHVKSHPETKAILRRVLTEGGARVLPKWLKVGGRIGSRLLPVIGWGIVVGDTIFGDPGSAY